MPPYWNLGDEDPLLGSGVIDSIGVIELVEFLQHAFQLAIAEEEITERNLGTLAAIGQFVYQKCHANGSGGSLWPRQVARPRARRPTAGPGGLPRSGGRPAPNPRG